MTSLWAKFGPFIVLVLFGGALVGALVGSEPLVPVALLLIIVCTLLGWRWPAAMVVAIGSSILLERAGILMTVVVPWTVAKVFVAGAIGLWGFQRILKRKRILRLTPTNTTSRCYHLFAQEGRLPYD